MAEDYGGARDATPSGAVTPPAPGQLARVLGRMWAVEEVARHSQASLDARPLQNHVSLVSVEDDAAGEVLEVIGEVEPGKRVIERAELPVIVSIDWLKGELGMRLWREVLPGTRRSPAATTC